MKAEITQAQAEFLDSKERGTIFQGGIGAGKTYVNCIRAVRSALQGRHYALVSFSYPTLRDVALVTLKDLLFNWGFEKDVHYHWNKSEMTFDFPQSDGKILLRSGDRPDSLRGLNLDDFGLDEAREWKDDEIYRILIGRLRRSENATWCITTTTNGRNWVYGLSQEKDVKTLTQSTMSNPFLPQSYIDELLSRYSNDFARQELYAEIVEFGAGIIQPSWFKMDPGDLKHKVRAWDIAVTIKKSSDFSAGALCAMDERNRFLIKDINKQKMQWPELRTEIINQAWTDGPSVPIVMEQAGQQAALIQDLRSRPEMVGFEIRASKPNGDKLARAMPWIASAEGGMVYCNQGKWNQDFFDECLAFSGDDSHAHDDQIDAVSYAHDFLSRKLRAGQDVRNPLAL